jgi:hypothetical protein
MTSFQNVIDQTRVRLMTAAHERISQLATTIDSDDTSLTLLIDAPQIHEGDILGIELEELYVITKSGTTVTVIRGFNGSAPITHLADTIIRINPKFTDYRLGMYFNETLDDLSGDGLFQLKDTNFTFNPSRNTYELTPTDLIDVRDVKYDIPGPTKQWVPIDKNMWYVDHNADTTEFPSGISITLQMGGFPNHKVMISYKAGYTHLANPTDNVLTSGLHLEAFGLAVVGTAIHALGGREVKRTFLTRQPDTRRADEVPAGAANQAMRPLLQEYSDKLSRERKRLRRKYPDQVF